MKDEELMEVGDEYDDIYDENVITLLSATGEEIDFVEIALIAYKSKFYAILQPVEPLEDMDEDEALVFEVTKDENNEDKFIIILDDEIIDAVFEEYNKLYDEAHADDDNDN